jgi:hypothetical protein
MIAVARKFLDATEVGHLFMLHSMYSLLDILSLSELTQPAQQK